MSMVTNKIEKAILSLELAEKQYKDGDKRLALGDLDYAYDYITASKCLLIAEIEEENKHN